LTRDELMKAVWPNTVVEENNLTVNISLLRKTLGDAEDGKAYIETAPRRGYRFHQGVTEIPEGNDPIPGQGADTSAEHAAAPAPVAAPPAGVAEAPLNTPIHAAPEPAAGSASAPAGRESNSNRSRAGWSRALFILVGACICLAVYFTIHSSRHLSPSAALGAGAPRSLAVLPFQNLRRVTADNFLGFALADAVITKLGYVSHLSVRPSSSVARFDTPLLELQKIATELKVDTLLTGTFVHEGDDLRLSAQLVEATTQRMLWSNTINLKYENLLSIQDRVALEIVAGLQVPLSGPEAARLAEQRSAKADAYEEYLKGVDFYAQSQFEQSISSLEDSARLDPNYPLTWAMLGRAYTTDASLHFGGRREYSKALFAYQNALRLDPAQIEPRVYMANMFTDTGRVEDAVPLLQEALKVNPNHAEANWEISYAYRFAGLQAASVASAERARRLDPSVKLNSSAMNGYLYLGRYDDFLERLPTQGASAYILFYRGFAEYYLGRHSDALRDFEHAFELDASLLQTQVGKALSYKLKDDVPNGVALLHGVVDELMQRGVTDAEGIYKVAQAYAQLDDTPSALSVLEKSVDGGFFPFPYIQRDPMLAPIRKAAEYPRILEKARLRFEKFKNRYAPDAG
jgi:TolB-like protein